MTISAAPSPSVPTLDRDLEEALRLNDPKAFRAALRAGVSVATRKDVFLDVLHRASDREELVKIILAIAEPDPGFEPNWCSVSSAAFTGNRALLEILLDAGHPVDEPDSGGCTALYWAATFGNVDLMDCLLRHGADKNARNRYGRTALHAAVSTGQLSAVTFLIERGVALDVQTERGHAPLHVAMLAQDLPLITALIEGGSDLNAQVDHMIPGQDAPLSPLMYASAQGNLDVMRALLHHGCSVNEVDSLGRTALHFAARSNKREEAVKLLLDNGADVNARLADGKTVLHLLAANNSSPATLVMLLEAGATVNAKTSSGLMPLHAAIMTRKMGADSAHPKNLVNTQVIRVLLDAGADVNALYQRGSGEYPIHFAAVAGSEEIVAMLVAAGASLDTRTANGHTAETLATDPGVVAILRSYREQAALREVVGLPSCDLLGEELQSAPPFHPCFRRKI